MRFRSIQYPIIMNLLKAVIFLFLSCTTAPGAVLDASLPISAEAKRISDAAISLTRDAVTYDPTYFNITYPNGDVPKDKGVCTDVVIRAYRKLGVDLQQLVHDDMQANFAKYPQKWGLKKPDTNIDHRRVPNLMYFFSRFGKVKPMTKKGGDYKPGEIVAWKLVGGQTHIGLVINRLSGDKQRYMIVHNIGSGQVVSDCLFDFEIIGHYYYDKIR
jgi:uncharacterized protein